MPSVLEELHEEGLLTIREVDGEPRYTLTPRGVEVVADLLQLSPAARAYLRELREKKQAASQ